MKQVMLTRVQAEKLWIAEHKRKGEWIIPSMMHRVTDNGGEYLLHTGAKLYRRVNGGPKPFMISGYAYDGSDVDRALNLIQAS
jgi:hypothetical protein